MTGFVKLHRELLEHSLLTSVPAAWLKVFIIILLRANWKQGEWRGQTLQPGEWITSSEKLAEICGISRKQVRGALEYLKRANIAAIETASGYTRITLLNWATYQHDENAKGQQEGQPKGQQRASEGPAKGHNQRRQEKQEGSFTPYPLSLADTSRARGYLETMLAGKQ